MRLALQVGPEVDEKVEIKADVPSCLRECLALQMGLEVDEAVEAEADMLYRQGMERFRVGDLNAALKKFDEAAKMVQTRVSACGWVGQGAAG